MIPFLLAASLLSQAPSLPELPPIHRDPQVVFLDRTGAQIGVRGGRYAPPADLDRLPAYVPAAFVAVEDRRFYEHAGFDAIGIARAMVKDLSKGRMAEGASTLTQQLARNLFLSSDKTMERKATELVYAVELEQRFSKKQILGLYLSRVYFGSGAYGIDAAARRYFDKPASALTLSEAAMLAGVVRSPAAYDPAEHPDQALAREAVVLQAMADTGAITPAARERALAAHPRIARSDPLGPAQYFVDYADAQTHSLIGDARQDLVVRTTLDLAQTRRAAHALAEGVAAQRDHRAQQGAEVSIEGDGAVIAMAGGVDYGQSSFNRALARRPAGSSWKAFVYLTALEAGWTPDSQVTDAPVTIAGWSPRNFEPDFLGPVTLRVAYAQSVNTVAAQLADFVGRDRVAATAKRLGIASPISLDPAMALGTSAVTPLEMAGAYATFSAGGQRVAPYAVTSVRTVAGVNLYQRRPQAPAQIVDNPALGELDDLMRGVVANGTGVRAAVPGRDVAGKTGTTSDSRDAWFCGYANGVATVVWMGRDDDGPMPGLTGGVGPAPVFRTVMAGLLANRPSLPIPAGPAPSVAAPGVGPPPAAPGAVPAGPPGPPPPAAPAPFREPEPIG